MKKKNPVGDLVKAALAAARLLDECDCLGSGPEASSATTARLLRKAVRDVKLEKKT